MSATRNPSQVNGNPFLEALDPILSDTDLHKRLRFSPLDGINTQHLNKEQRYTLLDRMQLEYFVPSLTSVDITTRIYRMIRRSYIARDPTQVQSRVNSMAVSKLAGAEMRNLPWLPAYALGMRTIGITGLGKTYETRRAIAQLPPRIEHGPSAAADWTHFYQAPYLYVGMSHDGSIGGLLFQILVALDAAIFTDYSSQRRYTGLSNEKLAVQVGIILSNHGVGVLIIDEIQKENFSDGARGTLARTFFLRMLNFGIPILLIGNPAGMQFLGPFSQDVRRLSSCGTIDLHPVESTDTNFVDVLVPEFWQFNVMPEPPRIHDPDGKILHRYCGGIRDYAGRVIAVAQRIALDLNENHISQEHLDMAFNGPDFSIEERTIIQAFNQKDANGLSQFADIPWESYLARWNPEIVSPTARRNKVMESADQVTVNDTPCAEKAALKIRASRTRKAKRSEKEKQTRSELSSTDLRADGIKDFLVTSLAKAVDNRP